MVEGAARAQVDVNPFHAGTGAHPGAGEAVGTADLDALVAPEERDLSQAPDRFTRVGSVLLVAHRAFDPVEAAATHGFERNERREEMIRGGESGWIRGC